MSNTITPKIALDAVAILDKAASQINLSRNEHITLQSYVQVLKQFIAQQEEETDVPPSNTEV